MAGSRLLADGRRSSADDWRRLAVPDGQRRKIGEIRSIVAGRVSTPSGRLHDPSLAVVMFSSGLHTTLAFNPHSLRKDERARLETVGGCARACTNALF